MTRSDSIHLDYLLFTRILAESRTPVSYSCGASPPVSANCFATQGVLRRPANGVSTGDTAAPATAGRCFK